MRCNAILIMKRTPSVKKSIQMWVDPARLENIEGPLNQRLDKLLDDLRRSRKGNIYWATDERGEYIRCQGKILVDIQAVDEPYFGGSSASLEITYKCNECGCTSFMGRVPTDTTNFLQTILDKME